MSNRSAIRADSALVKASTVFVFSILMTSRLLCGVRSCTTTATMFAASKHGLSHLRTTTNNISFGEITRRMTSSTSHPSFDYDIIKPKLPRVENREFEAFFAKNGLRVVLISDPKADRCAAAMSIGVGSFGERYPGTAHLLEHMLNTDSAKFPTLHTFSKFLDIHGGEYNAMTSDDFTLYFFEVIPDYLYKALEIFLDTFISPLISAEAVAAEIEAVDHEFQKNIGSDTFRMYDFINSRMNHKHPASKFTIGNEYSLRRIPEQDGTTSQEVVKSFYENEYSSNIMSFAVIGNEPIEAMKKVVMPWIEQIPNKNLKFKTFSPANPLEGACMGKLYKVLPATEIHRMAVVFGTEDLIDDYPSNPLIHINFFLGKSHEHSLSSFLQSKGWGSSVSIIRTTAVRGTSIVAFTLDLSSEGIDHYEEIGGFLFNYLNLFKTTNDTWRLDEHKRQADIDFNFRDKSDSSDHVSRLVEAMLKAKLEDIEWYNDVIEKVNFPLFKRFLNAFEPRKCAVFLFSKKFENECKQTDKWYGLRYHDESLGEQVLTNWEKESKSSGQFSLPAPNPYIPTNLDLSSPDTIPITEFPSKIVQSDKFSTWYKKHSDFLQPRVQIQIFLTLPDRYLNIDNYVTISVFRTMLVRAIERKMSDAAEAGYHMQIEFTTSSIIVKYDGFSEKIKDFVDKTLAMVVLEIQEYDKNHFQLAKDLNERRFKNMDKNSQRTQSSNEMLALTGHCKYVNGTELEQAANRIAFSELPRICEEIYNRGRAQLLIVGDTNIRDASEMSDIVRAHLDRVIKESITAKDQEFCYEIDFDPKTNIRRRVTNKANPANAVLVRYICGRSEISEYTKFELINEIINEEFFDDLRTKQNLGYIALTKQVNTRHSTFFSFYIQSDYDCEYVDGRIETFIARIKEFIGNLTDEQFAEQKQSLTSKLLKRPDNLHELVERYESELILGQFVFDRRQREVDEIAKFTKQHLFDAIDRYLALDSPERRKLSIYVTPDPSLNNKQTIQRKEDDQTNSSSGSDSDDELVFARTRDVKSSKRLFISEQITSYIENAEDIQNLNEWQADKKKQNWTFTL